FLSNHKSDSKTFPELTQKRYVEKQEKVRREIKEQFLQRNEERSKWCPFCGPSSIQKRTVHSSSHESTATHPTPHNYGNDLYYDIDVKETLNQLPREILDMHIQRLKQAMNLFHEASIPF
ncbi:hypothetical protein Csa_023819, partial [Cucumis sativus]